MVVFIWLSHIAGPQPTQDAQAFALTKHRGQAAAERLRQAVDRRRCRSAG